MDLALDNQKRLRCHKTQSNPIQPNQTKPNLLSCYFSIVNCIDDRIEFT